MKPIAVVILNWNGTKLLQQYLPSVCAHTDEAIADVIVADNGSTDNSLDVMRNEFPSVRVMAFPENYGFAEGYNRAIAELQEYPYIVLLNSDVATSKGWLQPLYEYAEQHPDVAALQPKIRAYREPEAFEYAGACGGYLDCNGYAYCRGRIFDTVERDNGQYDDVCEVAWASGAALFVRTELYMQAGGLDAAFFAHMEEIDLCWRLHSRGRGVVCIPQSVVYHVGAATLKKENPRKTFLNFRNNLLMLYKNLPKKDLKKVMFIRGLLDWVAALVFLLKGDGKNARAVWQARKEFKRICPDFASSRTENLAKATGQSIPEKVDYSILWKFHACGKKEFSRLK